MKKERDDLALHSSVTLTNVPLGDSHFLTTLRDDAESRDEWRFLRSLENRAPFRIGLGQDIPADVEYRWNGVTAEGLGFAHMFDGIALSFAGESWGTPFVDVVRLEMDEGGDISEAPVSVRNASTLEHIDAHRNWCRSRALIEPEDGDELWLTREQRFPRIYFLSRVEAQIRSLKAGNPHLTVVNQRLWEIQAALAAWDHENHPLPAFQSKVSPEHENRRALFMFSDQNNVQRCFDLHLRFTPGAGRIHLWCDRSDGTAQIAHVGEKVADR